MTSLYTLLNGKFNTHIEVKGKIPDHVYILINNNCELAYTFYDKNYSVSKNFKEDKSFVADKKVQKHTG